MAGNEAGLALEIRFWSRVTNVLRGDTPAALSVRQGLCVAGLHEMSRENVRVRLNGKRECRSCASATKRAHRVRNQARINAYKRIKYAANPEPVRAAVRLAYARSKGGG